MEMIRKRKRVTIGVLVSGIMDVFTESICKGIRQAARTLDINVVVMPGKYLDRDLRENRELIYEYQYNTVFSYAGQENVDAIIVAGGSIGCYTTEERLRQMLSEYENIPCVLVATKLPGYVDVTFDNYNGIHVALEYLIDKLHCRRFGMIGGPASNSDAIERKQAFESTLREHGIEVNDRMYVEGDFSKRCAGAYRQILDQNPDLEAVFCVNDESAMGFYEELDKRGIVPGRDISVLGYDDTIAAAKMQPSLSSVRADSAELGENAVKMALRMVYGEQVESLTLPTKFVLRNSFCQRLDQEEEAADRELAETVENLFDDIFYRYLHEDMKEQINQLRREYQKLMENILLLFDKHEKSMELYMDIQTNLDRFLQMGAVEYADMDNLLLAFEKIYHMLKRKQQGDGGLFELRDFFSIIYRKVIRAMDYHLGGIQTAQETKSYSMKLFVRDMLQFEKGNDQSYAAILNNLGWLNIKNAFLYLFEKPIVHLYLEKYKVPKSFYLKAYLWDGKVYSVPAIQQKFYLRNLFELPFVEEPPKYSMVLLPLFSNELLYGLLLCDLTDELFANGEFLINQMGAATKMIDLLKSNESIQQQLEESLATLKENNIVLNNLSRSDGLTGILNRRGFYDTAEELLEKGRAQGKTVLVIYVDMNNLKIINDKYGHEEGDFSLKLIGEKLTEVMGECGVAGRIGGDEFACITEYDGGEEGQEILSRIYRAFEAFNRDSEKSYNVTVSAGACVLKPADRLTIAEAMTQADEKLYEVKKHRIKEVAKKK